MSWVDLLARDALEPGDATAAEAHGRRFAVYDAPDGIYVTAALCTHGGAALCDGYFDGWIIECPLHQGAFDVRDGRPVAAPATRPLRCFAARVAGGRVQVKL